jgi:prepilin-type N-terminal cleavage/methylation domain-containing protein
MTREAAVRDRDGFTLVEVIVAIVILAIGSLMLAGGSLFVTRELVRTKGQTSAQALAQSKSDELRAWAASTSPMCGNSNFVSSSTSTVSGPITLSWTVQTSGSQRTVRVFTTYKLGRNRTKTDTLTSFVACL